MSESAGYGHSGGGSLLEEFFVRLGVRADHGAIEKFQHAISSVHHMLEALGVMAAVELGHRLMEFVEHAVESAAAVQETSEAIGVAATSVDAFDRVAGQAGVSADQMHEALMGVTRAAGAAAAGFPRYTKLFKQLGIDTKDAATGALKTTDELFAELSDKFAKWDPGMRLAVAGHLGLTPKLSNLMAEMGGEEFLDAVNKARKGGFLTDQDYKRAHETEIAFMGLHRIIGQITTLIGNELAPAIMRVTDAFTEWWTINRNDVLTKFGDWLWIVIYYIGRVYDGIVNLKNKIVELWAPFNDIITPLQAIETIVTALVALKFATWISGVVAALWGLLPILGPVGLILADIFAIIAVAHTLKENWGAVISWFGEAWDTVVDKVRRAVEWFFKVDYAGRSLRWVLGKLGVKGVENFLDKEEQRQNDQRTIQHDKQERADDMAHFLGTAGNWGAWVPPALAVSSAYAPPMAAGQASGGMVQNNTKVDIGRVDIRADKGREAAVGEQLHGQVKDAVDSQGRGRGSSGRARNAQGPFKS
jgi:hypothetical protein